MTPACAALSDFGVTKEREIAQRNDSHLFNPYYLIR